MENSRYQIPKLDCSSCCRSVKLNFQFSSWITATTVAPDLFFNLYRKVCLVTCWRSVPQWWERIPVCHHYLRRMWMLIGEEIGDLYQSCHKSAFVFVYLYYFFFNFDALDSPKWEFIQEIYFLDSVWLLLVEQYN